jgi:hypothetical protein
MKSLLFQISFIFSKKFKQFFCQQELLTHYFLHFPLHSPLCFFKQLSDTKKESSVHYRLLNVLQIVVTTDVFDDFNTYCRFKKKDNSLKTFYRAPPIERHPIFLHYGWRSMRTLLYYKKKKKKTPKNR